MPERISNLSTASNPGARMIGKIALETPPADKIRESSEVQDKPTNTGGVTGNSTAAASRRGGLLFYRWKIPPR